MLICPSRNVCVVSWDCEHAIPHEELHSCTTEICEELVDFPERNVTCIDIFLEIVKERIDESERDSSNH